MKKADLVAADRKPMASSIAAPLNNRVNKAGLFWSPANPLKRMTKEMI
jgi:hypothetical protein